MRILIASVVLLFVSQPVVEAGLFRRNVRATSVSSAKTVARPIQTVSATQSLPSNTTITTVPATSVTTSSQTTDAVIQEVPDALAEVNAARAKRGLRPFQHDPQLTQAAMQCAQIRASRRIAGHLANDFAYLPSGSTARSAGCGAMEPSWGWGTCCTYENYTYAGAAWVMGSDGKRYMHLFVR